MQNSNLEQFFLGKHNLAVTSLFSITIAVCGFIAHYLLNLVFARHLSPAAFGDLSIIFRVITLCATLGMFGTNVSVIRFLPEYLGKQDRAHAGGLLKWDIRIITRVTFLITILGALIACTAFILDAVGYTTLDKLHPVIFAFWLVPLYVFTFYFGKVIQGDQHFQISLFTINVGSALLELFIVLLVIFIFKTINIYAILFVIGISHMLIVTFQLITLRRTTLKKIGGEKPKYDNKKWFTVSVEMLINNVVTYTATSINLILLEILGNNEADVGIFAAILTIYSVMFLINQAIRTIVNPKISKNFANQAKLQGIITRSNLIQLCLALPALIVCLVFSKEILAFFRPSFVRGDTAFLICIIGAFLSIFFAPCGALLLFLGFQKTEVRINTAYLFVSIILSFILIPRWQLLGAAIAMVAASMVAYLYDFIIAKKRTGIKVLFFI